MPRNGHAEWGNPLSWKDNGDMDDSVVLQTLMEQYRSKKPKGRLGSGDEDESWRNAVDGAGRAIYDKDGDGVEDNV